MRQREKTVARQERPGLKVILEAFKHNNIMQIHETNVLAAKCSSQTQVTQEEMVMHDDWRVEVRLKDGGTQSFQRRRALISSSSSERNIFRAR